MPPITSRNDIKIAIICALPCEARALKTILEEAVEDIEDGAGSTARKNLEDNNTYTVGSIASHLVVLVYNGIKLALLVGICGGVPNENEHIKRTLGDVVIGTHVIRYDFDKQDSDGFNLKESSESAFSQQPIEVRAFIAKLKSRRQLLTKQTEKFFTAIFDKSLSKDLKSVKKFKDSLYYPDYWHIHRLTDNCTVGNCIMGSEICDNAKTLSCEELKCEENGILRTLYPTISSLNPDVHFGVVASGDTVMKGGEERDRLAEEYNAIAFDMQSAGICNDLPYLTIKGISDYSDSHKNVLWQDIAAHTAAACAKAVVEQWHSADQLGDFMEQWHLADQLEDFMKIWLKLLL